MQARKIILETLSVEEVEKLDEEKRKGDELRESLRKAEEDIEQERERLVTNWRRASNPNPLSERPEVSRDGHNLYPNIDTQMDGMQSLTLMPGNHILRINNEHMTPPTEFLIEMYGFDDDGRSYQIPIRHYCYSEFHVFVELRTNVRWSIVSTRPAIQNSEPSIVRAAERYDQELRERERELNSAEQRARDFNEHTGATAMLERMQEQVTNSVLELDDSPF
jgi:hypothetical protein